MNELKGFSSVFLTRDNQIVDEIQRFFEKKCIYPHFRQMDSIEGLGDILRSNEWDNIIYDNGMTNVDLLEVLKSRERERSSLPVIVLSSEMENDNIADLFKKGIDNFVSRSKYDRLLDAISQERELRERKDQSKKYKNLREFSNRYELVRRFAGGVSHSINNMLMVILNSAIFLKDDRGLLPHLKEDVEEILNAVQRGQSYIRNLLMLAGGHQLNMQIIDVNSFLYKLADSLRRGVGGNIDINVTRLQKSVEIKADENILLSAFSKIADNSKYFMPRGGEFHIKTELVDFDSQDEFVEAAGIKAGEYVKFTFSDTGVGIDEESKAHIFEPYYTTKGLGIAAGLGLSILYGIIWEHNGAVDVDSELNKGTNIYVYLPVFKRDSKEILMPKVSEYAPKKRGSVLVVDDDEDVKNILIRVFSEEGFNVSSAVNGLGAIVMLEKMKPKDLVALVTDVIMPNMNGVELAREVRQKYKDVKVIFISGYPDNDQEVLRFENSIFIQKPINRQDLMKRVKEFISGEESEIS